jgi:hypothetical protein
MADIHVDKYTLPNGDALFRLPNGNAVLVPGQGINALDTNAVESGPVPQETAVPQQTAPVEDTIAPEEDRREDTEPAITKAPTAPRRSLVKPSYILVPLVLLLLLSGGAASYFFLLPLTASATITITPDAQTLQKTATLTIAAHPNGASAQVQGRELAPFSLAASKTVAATGHAHQDATQASGVITLYNSDSQPITIPAGVAFTASNGATIVTEQPVTIQAAVLPAIGTAITPAHVVQAGSFGNISAHTVYTRCCGSVFVTATNTTPFSGGQDERDYTYIQQSDIQSAATGLLNSLTPRVSAALNKEARKGESLVTPLCTPRTIPSANESTEAASFTVSVTQTCYAAAYQLDSLEQSATTLLAHSANLTNYVQADSVQVTVNGSTYTKTSAQLRVSLSGGWVYHFSQEELTHLTRLIAGEIPQSAAQQLEREPGVEQVSIHVSRLDFKNQLPTDATRIHIVLFVVTQP